MKATARQFTIRGLLGLTCFLLSCGIFYAGLNPFHVPANQVTWLAEADGLRFGEHGTAFASSSFPPSPTDERSIEFWAKPGLIEDSSTLLAFYSPANPRQLWLSQAESDLRIQIQPSSAWRSVRSPRFSIDNAFRDGRNTFWTLAFGKSSTAVYRNGELIRETSLAFSGSELSGQLILANSPIFHESWSGVLHGLAIFDKALDGAQAGRHYATWKQTGEPALTADDACIALYLFNERAGDIVHNRVREENELYIPRKFTILRQTLLDPIWRAFDWTRGFWTDTFINIAGFIPFAFFFCAWFSARSMKAPAFRAALFGATISVLIEVTQAYLPTRDSSMSDVITNSLGSAIGAAAYRGFPARTLQKCTERIVRFLNQR